MRNTLNIVLAQLNPVVGDLVRNKDKILKAWKGAPAGSDLVVFSELVICGYPPEDLVLKPFFIDHVEAAIEDILKKSAEFEAAALIGCPIRKDGKIYNAVHLVENGRIVATQTKSRLPNYDVFDEERVFEPGPLPAPVRFRGHTLGILICEDMWTADVAAHLRDGGAEIFIVPNGSPFDTGNIRDRHAQALARVNENGLPLVYVNQIGGQDELVFDGASFVMDAKGQTVLQGRQFVEDVYTASFSKKDKSGWDIRAETRHALPGEIETIYEALKLGLRDYIGKNGFPGVLIGLSGGIDSALSAAIAADALGPEAVHGVMMPSRFTAQESLEDAKALADNLGIRLDHIQIEGPVGAFHEVLKPLLPPEAPATTFENIQPRTRGLILMALSNASGKMVLSTGNKSEMAAGYATLYGDMCGGFNVLKDVYKMQVYALAKWRNTQGAVIPERSITRAPTAELRENQTDQDTLPPYETLDDILYCLIEQDMGIDEIVKRGHESQTVARVWKMLDRAEYKRRQAPPGVKISPRAFGRDRRYPITNHFVNIIEKSGS
jgi:NAD+ synthase